MKAASAMAMRLMHPLSPLSRRTILVQKSLTYDNDLLH
jgi:hypothetical protein